MIHHDDSQSGIVQSTLLIDIATRNVIRLAPGDSIGGAARIMAEKRISSLVVTDEDGHPVGIVTERNMLHAMQSGCKPDTTLQNAMSSPVITVPESMTCLDAYQLCLRDGIRHLVIVGEEGRLSGVVSETDFRLHINLAVLAGRRQIASVMSRSVFCLPREASLRNALNLMQTHKDTCVVVVDAEHPVGIVTERDVVRLYSRNPDRTDIPIGEVMTSPVLSIPLDNTINEAAERMINSKVRHLVVVDRSGRVAGLLSEHDLTHAMTLGLIDDKLIAESTFLHTLINTLPDLVWLKDEEGVYLACNPRFERFFGAQEKDIVGKTDYDFVDKELADFFRAHDSKAMNTGEPSVNEEWVTFADDGHRELLETLKTPMRDSQGKLIGVLGIARDITKRRQLEEKLKQGEKKFRDIFESASDCIELISLDGVIIDLNHVAYERLGYTKAEMQGMHLEELNSPENAVRLEERSAQIISQGSATFESARLHKNGSVIPIEVSSKIVEIDGQKLFLSISREISERKRIQDALYFVAQRGWMNQSENFFNALAQYLGKTLAVEYVIIDKLDENPDIAETIALYAQGSVIPNMRYNLKGTPCENVMGRSFCYYGEGVQQLFPEDALLVQMGIESYSGIPLWDSSGQAIGLIAVMDSKPLANEASIRRMLEIMATRAAAELEQERSNRILSSREQEFRTLAENMPDNVIRYDLQCRVRYFNLALTRSFASHAQPVLGKTPVESHPDIEAVADYQRQMENAIITGQGAEIEILVPDPSGEIRNHHVRFVAEHDSDGKITGVLAIGRDITERKRAEMLLKESELQYRTLADSGQAFIWTANQDGECDYFNKVWLEFTGRTMQQEIGNGWSEDVHPEDREQCMSIYKSSFAKREKFGMDYRVRRHDGEYRWVRDDGCPRYNSEGAFIGYIGYCTDITERKLIEEERSRLSLALAQSEEAVALIDHETRYIYANPAFCKLFGYALDELIGNTVSLLMPPGELAGTTTLQTIISARDQGAFQGEVRRRTKSGVIIPILLKVSSFRDERECLIGYIASMTDLSEIKQMENALRESEKHFRDIIEFAPLGTVTMSLDGRFVDINQAFCDIVGYPKNALKKLSFTAITHPDDINVSFENINKLIAGQIDSYRIEKRYFHCDGHVVWAQVDTSLQRGLSGEPQYMIAQIEDITAHKRAEDALRESEEKLRTLIEAIPDPIQFKDGEGHWLASNAAARHAFGLDKIDCNGKSDEELSAIAHPSFREALLNCRKTDVQAWNTGGMSRLEEIIPLDDGSKLFFDVIKKTLFHKDGERAGLVIVGRDITELRQSQEALAEKDEKLRNLYNLSPLGIALTDMDGRYVEFNESFRSICGYPEEELKALDYWTLTPRKYELEEARQLELLATIGRYGPYEKEYVRKDGSLIPLRLNGLLMTGRDGQKYIWSIVEDITEHKQAEDALRENQNKYRLLFENASDGIFLQDASGFVDCNERGARMYGLSREELLGRSPRDLAPERQPDGRLSVEVADEKIAAVMRGEPQQFEWRPLRADGEPLDVEINLDRIELGDSVLIQAVVRDITERKQIEENLRITASVFDNSYEAILITDARNIITDVNQAFTKITGYSREEVIGKNPKLLSSGRQDKVFYSAMWQSLSRNKVWRGEIWNRRKSGEIYAELLSISVICSDDGRVQRHVAVFSDISYIKEHEAELSHVANYDALTGVPNRRLLADRLRQAILRVQRSGKMVAICYIDLDGFKLVNDQFGHEAGDQLLIEVTRRIQESLRAGDTLARLGGDEFVVLFNEVAGEQECLQVLDRILDVIALPVYFGKAEMKVSASIGVTFYPSDNHDGDTLLRHADQAMYVAKQTGKNHYHLYDFEHDQRVRSLHESRRRILQGLHRGEFELFYQPKIELSSGDVVGVEALIRWHHPERGLLLPAEFLPYIEDSDLEIRLGEWVMDTSLAQIDIWFREGLVLEVSINISAHHLQSADFVAGLARKLACYPDLPRDKLQIEVLETAALEDIAQSAETIEACRKLGVNFALDDFGTGYSSLSYLRKLSAETLKIDQSFVRGMLTNEGDRAIVQGIIALAKTFGRKTVAEGMEATELIRVLVEVGCMYGQGYGIAHPMPTGDFMRWYKERH